MQTLHPSKKAWLCGGSICKQKSYVDLTSKRGGLALWREHTQEEDLCRPHIQASRLDPVRRNIGKMSHIQDEEAWPDEKMMISSKQGSLGSEESLIQCWLALSKMTKLLDRFEDEATR